LKKKKIKLVYNKCNGQVNLSLSKKAFPELKNHPKFLNLNKIKGDDFLE